jgi:hypothetical protein
LVISKIFYLEAPIKAKPVKRVGLPALVGGGGGI